MSDAGCSLARSTGSHPAAAKRLKELEGENARLKKLLAEALLDTEALKAALGRKH